MSSPGREDGNARIGREKAGCKGALTVAGVGRTEGFSSMQPAPGDVVPCMASMCYFVGRKELSLCSDLMPAASAHRLNWVVG